MGIIYMGTSPSGKKYIGQHLTENLSLRHDRRMQEYRKYCIKKLHLELKSKLNPEISYPEIKGFTCALFNAFIKHSPKSFKWEILHNNIHIENLNQIEDEMILKHNTLSPNGYNLRLNNNHDSCNIYSLETRQKMSKNIKISNTKNIHKFRTYTEKLINMPKHISYYNINGKRGYRITRHPLCNSKKFMVSINSIITDDELKIKTS